VEVFDPASTRVWLWRYPEDSTLHNHRCQNLKSYFLLLECSYEKRNSAKLLWVTRALRFWILTPFCRYVLQPNEFRLPIDQVY
jgi:hypothetical protein